MPVNLLAICAGDGGLGVKRIVTSAEVQNLLEGVFAQQEVAFLQGITEEVAFDGGWHPEPNELLSVQATNEVETVFAAAQQEVMSLQTVQADQIMSEGIKGIGVLVAKPAGPMLLLQNFDARQILQNRFSLFLSGDTFNQLTAPAFSLATGLAGFVVEGAVKFRSFSNIRKIFALKHLYIEATDAQVDAFAAHASLSIADAGTFKTQADQGIRKLVTAIGHRGTLDLYTADQICTAADGEGLAVARDGARIVVPMDRQGAKRLLQFLDDGYYRARLTGVMYITNSKKALAN